MKNKIIMAILLCILVLTTANASDIYPNYIRGTVSSTNGVPAPAGTAVTIIVTSGEYKDYVMTVMVDSDKIPSFLRGSGYYDTRDDDHFNTGDTFSIIVDNGTHYGSASGTFYSFGNGAFNSSEVNILISSYKKETPSGGGGGGGGGGYDKNYNYIVPKPKVEDKSALIEDNAPPQKEQMLPPELAIKYEKTALKNAMAEGNFPYVILFLILIIVPVCIAIIIAFGYRKRENGRG